MWNDTLIWGSMTQYKCSMLDTWYIPQKCCLRKCIPRFLAGFSTAVFCLWQGLLNDFLPCAPLAKTGEYTSENKNENSTSIHWSLWNFNFSFILKVFFFYLPQNVGLSLFSMFFPCSSHSFMLISSVISSVIQPPTYCQTYSPGKLVENILRCTFIILGWLPLKFNFTHILWFQIPCRGVAAEIFYSHIFLLQVMRPARIHWRC